MNTIRLDVTLFRSLTLLLTTLLVVAFPVAAQTPAAPDNLGPTLSKVARSGTLFAAHRESAVPFSFLGDKAEEGTVYGYSWEICQHVAKAVNERLGREVRVVPVTVSANSRIMMVKVGMADLECGATTNSVARLKQAAFSNTIYVAGVRVMVRKDSGVKRIADLADKRVVTTLGTTADRLVKLAALANNITIKFVIGSNQPESMAMLVRGEADAFVGDDAIIAAARALSPAGDQYVFLDEVLSTEPYGIMLPLDDPQFKKLVDDVIVGLMQSGELGRLYDKWFTKPIPPNGINLQMPMSDLLKAAIANPNDRPVN
ncbi:MAG: amino acid ABC transporter substrate-binding protein [Azonexus sp.]